MIHFGRGGETQRIGMVEGLVRDAKQRDGRKHFYGLFGGCCQNPECSTRDFEVKIAWLDGYEPPQIAACTFCYTTNVLIKGVLTMTEVAERERMLEWVTERFKPNVIGMESDDGHPEKD